MTSEELRNIIKCGETSLVQFKQEFTTQKEMAAEMIAFANGRGGTILFGVKDKTGDILGLSYDEIQNTSRELGNTANEQAVSDVLQNIRKEVLEELTERQRLLIKRMVETGQWNALENVLENVLETSASLAAYFGVDARTIRRDLSALQAKDVIRHDGPDKGGRWLVKKSKFE